MTTISRSALVNHSPGEMYNLVNNVTDYPAFLPWCSDARIISQNEDEIRAVIRFSKHGVDTGFTTCNRLQKNKMIEMRLLEGPFRHLQGFWRFEALGEGASRISLDLDFEVSNALLRITVGPLFNQVANSLVDAFVKRAKRIYG